VGHGTPGTTATIDSSWRRGARPSRAHPTASSPSEALRPVVPTMGEFPWSSADQEVRRADAANGGRDTRAPPLPVTRRAVGRGPSGMTATTDASWRIGARPSRAHPTASSPSEPLRPVAPTMGEFPWSSADQEVRRADAADGGRDTRTPPLPVTKRAVGRGPPGTTATIGSSWRRGARPSRAHPTASSPLERLRPIAPTNSQMRTLPGRIVACDRLENLSERCRSPDHGSELRGWFGLMTR